MLVIKMYSVVYVAPKLNCFYIIHVLFIHGGSSQEAPIMIILTARLRMLPIQAIVKF